MGLGSSFLCLNHVSSEMTLCIAVGSFGGLEVTRWPLAGGAALLVSLVCRSVLHHFHFKGSVHSISFSPDGR